MICTFFYVLNCKPKSLIQRAIHNKSSSDKLEFHPTCKMVGTGHWDERARDREIEKGGQIPNERVEVSVGHRVLVHSGKLDHLLTASRTVMT